MRFSTQTLAVTAFFLAPGSVLAQMSCASLGSYLATQPYISQIDAATPLTTLITTGSPRCEANFVYSARGDVADGYAAGQQQRIGLRVAFPLNSSDGGGSGLGKWNGKVQNLGGSGAAGSLGSVTPATDNGYVGSHTDGGHPNTENAIFPVVQATNSLNYGRIEDFLVESQHQQYKWALELARVYYGTPATRNYWNGCSTGGRQGLSLAAKYGADFDGFLVGSPVNYHTRFQLSSQWVAWVNKDIANNSITNAKFAAVNASATAACDGMDGVVDGLLADPRKCTYDARNSVCGAPGAPAADCLTEVEAKAVNMIWDGPRNDHGTRVWYPFDRGITGFLTAGACGVQNNYCWTNADMTLDWRSLPLSQYDDLAQQASREFDPYFTNNDASGLDDVRDHGGKILMYHGWVDAVPPRQAIHYYNDAMDRFGGLEQTKPWFRLFMFPGMGHCAGGPGPQYEPGGARATSNGPQLLFHTMVDWVENGKAPDSIMTTNETAGVVTRSRPACPWPQTAIYKGSGDINDAANFACGGNTETKETACLQMVAKYQKETSKAYDTSGLQNPALCSANSGVPTN